MADIKEVKKFFERENMIKQLKAMAGYLIPGRKLDVRLNIGGGSYTDNKKIVVGLPELLMDKSKEEMTMALIALIGHESQHVVSSNFEAFKAYIENMSEYLYKKHRIPKGIGKKVAHGFGNSIEDGRIEKILCNKRPGYLKKIQFLNLLFWDKGVLKGESEYQDFMMCLITQCVAGIYPKGFDEVYKGSELEAQFQKIRPLIIKGINARTCAIGLEICKEIIESIEDYLVKILKAQMEHDKKMFEQMQDSPDFNNSEESETNDSTGEGSSSCHFTPEDMEDDEKGQDEENKKGSSQGKTKEKSNEQSKEEEDEGGSSGEESDEDEDEGEGSGSGEDSEEGEDSDSKGENEDDGDTEAGAEQDDASDSKNAQDSDNSSTEEQKGNQENGEGEQSKGVSDEVIQEALKALEEDLSDEADNLIKEVASQDRKDQAKADKEATLTQKELREMDKLYDSRVDFTENEHHTSSYRMPLELQRDAKRFKKDVERIFKNKEVFNQKNQAKGNLNGNDLWKTATRDYNVFSVKGTASQSDYVGYILQDGSGSMDSDNKQIYSAFACATIEEGLKGLIPLKITTFSATHGRVIHDKVKGFEENSKEKNYSFSYMKSNRTRGANMDGYSIRVATKELLRRGEKDKVLFILSDGLPSQYSGGIAQGIEDVKEAIKEARKKGIMVVSVVFGTKKFREDAMPIYKEMYEKNIISCDPKDISGQLTKVLKKIISK